jgi:hypothetical protein
MKNIFSTSIVILLAFSIVGYIFYINIKKDDANPFLFVPDNSALLLQFDQPGKVFGKLLEDTTVWESLTQVEAFKKLEGDILHLGAFLHEKQEYFDQLNNSPLIISFHPDKDYETAHVVFLSKMGVVPFRSDIKTFIELHVGPNFVLTDYESDNFNGFQLTNTENDRTFFFVFVDGVMIASSEKAMIEKAVETYYNNKTHFSQSKEFIQLQETSGDKVDARLFIHYAQLGELFKTFANRENFNALSWLNNLADWTETDLIIKNNEILLNGFTNYNKSAKQFLGDFTSQLGSEDKTINLLPFNTNIVLRQGFSDFQSYYSKYLKSEISKVDRVYADKISEFVGKEVSLASNATSEQEFKENTWGIIGLQSKKKARAVLNAIAKKMNSPVSNFEGYTIRQIGHNKLLSSMFGNIFSVITNNYYVFVGDYVVFANSPSSLIKLLQNYKTGKTLDLNESYKQFSDNLSTTSNLTLYINPLGIINLLPKFMNDETDISFMENAKTISHFKGMVFQYSRGESGMFYTSFYLNHGNVVQSDNISRWKISLSDEIVGQPYLVKDHSTNKYNVIVFDKSANMYLISTDGILLWKKRIDNLPISSIYEVDFFKNRKIQYLFNTLDFVYLIDKNGEMLINYPKKLNPSATNGLQLFDYSNTKNYRLLISLADKWTYNYTIKGKQIEGWNKPRMNNPIKEPVTRLVINDKDYIIITDSENNVKIVNRKGEVRITLKDKPNKARNSGYFENKTNSKGIIITTNQSGKLVYFNTNGQLKYTDFGDFSPEHFFLYEDFNNDGSIDFIFLDKNELKVFSRLKKEIFSYHFNSEIKIKPVFFKIGKNQKVLGIVADQEKTIYLFDDKGNIVINRGLVGETPFTVGSLNNNKELNLITAAGNVLYNYRLN